MFSSPFPKFISFFCRNISSKTKINLPFEEKKILQTLISTKRKAEFSLGRSCAHQALSKFKLESVPILRNPKTREPVWPESIRGSITHSGNFAAVAVGLSKDISGVGIDLEDLSRRINFNISKHVCVKEELEWLKQFNLEQANRNLRIIFSAKESIFKCFFPLSKTYLSFKDASIKINENNSDFSFTLSKECSDIFKMGFKQKGSYSIKNNFLLTSIYIKN